jgi:hypothetical protein
MRRCATILLLAALSLPPAVVAAAWLRSHFVHDSAAFELRRNTYILCSVRGLVGGLEAQETYIYMRGVQWAHYDPSAFPGRGNGVLDAVEPLPGTRHLLGGFIGQGAVRRGTNGRWIAIPYWLLTLICSLPLMLLLAKRLHHRHRVHRGLCTNCGYDLRASPDRCPECGQSIRASALAA